MLLVDSSASMHLDMDGRPRYQCPQSLRAATVRPRPRPTGTVPKPLCCRCAAQTSTPTDVVSRPNNINTHPRASESLPSIAVDDFISWHWNIPPENKGSPQSHWNDTDSDYFADLANYPKTDIGQPDVPSNQTAPVVVAGAQQQQQQQQHQHQHHQHQCTRAHSSRPVQPVQPFAAIKNTSHGQSLDQTVVSPARVSAITVPSSGSTSVPDSLNNYCSVTGNDSKQDLVRLVRTFDQLAKCGFYYSKLAMLDAKKKLSNSDVGTFLLRDSSDPRFLFSLSIRTKRGTTSIRIAYLSGRFLLDCEDKAKDHMPSADCVLKLVQMYVGQSTYSAANNCVFLESNGRRDTPVQMSKPCFDSPLSLKHMARKSLNGAVMKTPAYAEYLERKLPLGLKGYMNEYKYSL